MTPEIPQVGEIWLDTMASVEGIVSKVVGTIVTFTSFTGTRAAIQFNRSYTPWVIKQRHPKLSQACSRVGCTQPAFLQYTRPLENIEVVCSKHVPMGVRSTSLQELQPTANSFIGQMCWRDREEAIEVLGEVSNAYRRASLWTCSTCGLWWVHATLDDTQVIGHGAEAFLQLVPEGYMHKSTIVAQGDILRRAWTAHIEVAPRDFHQRTGAKPLDLFEHILRED